jgi:SAM-dependent methyltransferase
LNLLVPPRRPGRELLDDPALPSEEMARSLRDLDYVHRRWGGSRALARHLIPRMRRLGARTFVLLDIGAGSGTASVDLAAQLSKAGLDARVVATDLQWRHLAAGRNGSSPGSASRLAADAFDLPFRDGAADWAVSTLFFHHFSPEENVRLLRELARVARHGFALLDLRRHLFPLLFVKLAGRLAFESHASLHDGTVSVGQAYTPQEAREITLSAVPGSRVERIFPYRLLICRDPDLPAPESSAPARRPV